MARQNDQLVAVLARTGLETILAMLDSAEFDQDASEGPDELAAAAGGLFVPSRRPCLFPLSRLEAIRSPERSLGASPNSRLSRLPTARMATRAADMAIVMRK